MRLMCTRCALRQGSDAFIWCLWCAHPICEGYYGRYPPRSGVVPRSVGAWRITQFIPLQQHYLEAVQGAQGRLRIGVVPVDEVKPSSITYDAVMLELATLSLRRLNLSTFKPRVPPTTRWCNSIRPPSRIVPACFITIMRWRRLMSDLRRIHTKYDFICQFFLP